MRTEACEFSRFPMLAVVRSRCAMPLVALVRIRPIFQARRRMHAGCLTMVGSLPSPYVGDPLALEGASARLRRGLGLRVLSVAVAPASWQSKFISDLNRTFPGQQHRLTSLKVAGLDAIRCHGIPRDLIVATDMLLLDPGGESSAHFADDIRAIEEVLHSALPKGASSSSSSSAAAAAAAAAARWLLAGCWLAGCWLAGWLAGCWLAGWLA